MARSALIKIPRAVRRANCAGVASSPQNKLVHRDGGADRSLKMLQKLDRRISTGEVWNQTRASSHRTIGARRVANAHADEIQPRERDGSREARVTRGVRSLAIPVPEDARCA